MSGKPAARLGDPTQCPQSGHGSNNIATGSSDVLFDGQPAARLGDSTACGSALAGQVIPNVLINGRPAAVLGSTGSHGDVVIGGSGTVIIGGAVQGDSGGDSNSGRYFVPGSAEPTQALRQSTFDDGVPFLVEDEEEEDEQELPLQQRITLRVGMFFDGTLNNMNNAAFTAQCRQEDLNQFDQPTLEAIRKFCEAEGYSDFTEDGRFESRPDTSFGNESSNVALLYDLYMDQADMQINPDAQKVSIKVYIDGIGTLSGGDDSLAGYAFGQGETGVLERVKQSPALLTDRLDQLLAKNANILIERLEFDVFGFSRGAAAARHFANEVLRADGGVMSGYLGRALPAVAPDFSWSSHVNINFIGIFDTVAAIADPVHGHLSVGDAKNPGVNLQLARACAKQVVHLTAADEYRHNFSLNRVNSKYHEELVLPGVHSNLGGGYPSVMRERVLLGRPKLVRGNYYSLTGLDRARLQASSAWQQREAAEAAFRAKGLPGNGRFIKQELKLLPSNQRTTGQGSEGDVLLMLSMDRLVRGELSRVSLRIMHAKAVDGGVPFDNLNEHDRRFSIPSDLQPIASKVISAAMAGQNAVLSDSERHYLHGRYIHASANWNARWGFFPNKPRTDNQRAIYEDQQ
ncbi:PAAR domain-containing protein [uncultured Pseudomonas sp.]|uniref:PAAR domain-containing protein n=2 Tax=Pseudomonas TaxID=286 RepID=UPI0030DB502A|tara:strand:+ start:1731 stop:3620 length:1890 start_codon:yes stop_codon:yes gene_type:complete